MSKLVAGLMVVGAVSMFGVRSSAAADTAEKTIVEVAVAADNFKTLVTAVKAADLVETLSGKGPFTVLPRPTRPSRRFRRKCWLTC